MDAIFIFHVCPENSPFHLGGSSEWPAYGSGHFAYLHGAGAGRAAAAAAASGGGVFPSYAPSVLAAPSSLTGPSTASASSQLDNCQSSLHAPPGIVSTPSYARTI